MVYRFLILFLFCLLPLQSCSGDFSLSRRIPDEFTVVSHPPLTVPDDFTLPPPAPRQASHLASKTESQLSSHATFTSSDYVFVAEFGKFLPQIRPIIDHEYHEYASSLRSKITDRLGISSVVSSPFTVIVNPTEENERLRKLKVSD